MGSPDDDTGHAAGARFERGKVSDAAFIGATAVIDDEDVARFGILHRFQKDIDAAEVGNG